MAILLSVSYTHLLKGWLRSLDQSDSVGRNAQPFAGKAEMFLGCGLYAHSVQRQAEGIGDILTVSYTHLDVYKRQS